MAIGNRIENGIIAAVTFIITTAVITLMIHFVSIKPLERVIDKQTSAIVELGKAAKYQIQNDFEKMRTKGNGQIILDLDNTLSALELEAMPGDTTLINQDKKQSLWKQIFGNGKD
jgi:hypothetical protein